MNTLREFEQQLLKEEAERELRIKKRKERQKNLDHLSKSRLILSFTAFDEGVSYDGKEGLLYFLNEEQHAGGQYGKGSHKNIEVRILSSENLSGCLREYWSFKSELEDGSVLDSLLVFLVED